MVWLTKSKFLSVEGGGPSVARDFSKYLFGIPLLILLITAGLAGNYFKFELFLNVDFLFGSIFAMLVLQYFGLGRGVVAAALIASYTYILWSHPYAIIVLTAEVAVVSMLMKRRKMGLVLADTLYWLFVGMPLIFLFYHLVMQLPLGTSYLVMAKQAVNGIVNALIARLIYSGFNLGKSTELTSYRENIYNLIAFFVLCPTLIMLALSSRSDFARTDQFIRVSLMQESQQVALIVNTWLENRTSIIVNLATMAAIMPPEQLQPRLDQARAADVNFLRIGMRSNDSVVMAYSPLIDDFGKPNVGKKFAERPYIPKLSQTLKPMLAEVVMARINSPTPAAIMLTPILKNGEFSGYINGVLNLDQLETLILGSANKTDLLYTLIDQKGVVITSNHSDQTVMKPFAYGNGITIQADDDLNQYNPKLDPNTPAIERWEKSHYRALMTIGDQAEWTLILDQPIAPYQDSLFNEYTNKFLALFVLLLATLGLAEILSRRVAIPLERLNQITHELPVRLAMDGKEIEWPQSRVEETTQLIDNFKQMANSLTDQFQLVKKSNESLERQVEERTIELRESERGLRQSELQLLVAQELGKTGSWIYNLETGKIWASAEGSRIYGLPPVAGGLSLEIFEACIPESERVHKALINLINKGQEYNLEFSIYPADGSPPREIVSIAQIEKDAEGNPFKVLGFIQDITERKRAAEARDKLQAQLTQFEKAESLSRMAGAIAHHFNNQLSVVLGNLELALDDLPGDTEIHGFLNEAIEAAQRSSEISGLMLTYLGQSTIKLEVLNLSEVCRHILPLLNDTIQKNIILETDFMVSGPVVAANSNQIQIVLTNLIANSVEAIGDRMGEITLKIKTIPASDIPKIHIAPIDWQFDADIFVCLEVKDTGCGISDQDIDKIFDPFFTTKFTGRGLGLPVVLGTVKTWKGAVSVESRKGNGSTFRIFLPLSTDELPQQSEKARGTNNIEQHGTVLLVDDQDLVRKMIGAILKRLGFSVLEAADGIEGLELFAQHREEIRCVITDLTMPGMNGWEIFTALKKIQPNLPVILVSGYDEAQAMEWFDSEKPQAFLRKPFSKAELEKALNKFL